MTVVNESGEQSKKWLGQVTDTGLTAAPEIVDGQLFAFGRETVNFTEELSQEFLEVYEEFEDKFAWRRVVLALDKALGMPTLDQVYEGIEIAEEYFNKCSVYFPFILQEAKSDIEVTKMVKLLADVAGIPYKTDNQTTITNVMKTLKKNNLTPEQMKPLYPIFKLLKDSSSLKFDFVVESVESEIITLVEENLDDVMDIVEWSEFEEVFADILEDTETDISVLEEGLSVQGRIHLSNLMRRRADQLQLARTRAIGRGASRSVLMQRARRLAVTSLKNRLTHGQENISLGEKNRIEKIIKSRKSALARIANKLFQHVKTLQSARLAHHA